MRNHPAEEAKTPSVFRPFEFQTKIQDIPIHLLLVPWPTRMEIAQRWKILYLGPFFTPMKAAGVSGVLPAFEMTNSFELVKILLFLEASTKNAPETQRL